MGTNEKIETIEKEIANIESNVKDITIKVQAINSVMEEIKSEEQSEITVDKIKDYLSKADDSVWLEVLKHMLNTFDSDVIKDELGWITESMIDDDELFEEVWDNKSSYEQREFVKDWIDDNY